MTAISCSKCKKDNGLMYFSTSCGDLILCEDCSTKFLIEDHSICYECQQKVEILPYQDDDTNKEAFCDVHQKKCEFFCQDCQHFLCGDCILEQLHKKDDKHVNHKILKIGELQDNPIFDKANQQAADAIKILQPLYSNIVRSIKKYKSIKAKIESTYDDAMICMHDSFDKIQRHVLKAKEVYDNKIIENVNKNENLMRTIQQITNDSEEVLTSSDSQISSVSFSICKRISNIIKEVENETDTEIPELPKNIFTNELVPPFSGFTIVIPKFVETYKSNDFKTIYSPSVDMYHGKWRTKIQLSEKDDSTYLSIFLEFLSGIGSPIVMEYKVQISHPTKNEYLSKSFKSEFNVMDSWGWMKFAQIDTIINDGFVKDDDSLSLEIKLRPSSYAEYTKIFEKLLTRYKNKYKEIKNKRKDTESNNIDQNTKQQKT